ncbi:hypothetical protein ACHAXR_011658 [Thalassiosira sp. AJA248-18]
MSNTVLDSNNSSTTTTTKPRTTRNSTGRVTRSQLEEQQKLKALYAESLSIENSDPTTTTRRVTRSKVIIAKENISENNNHRARNSNSMPPILMDSNKGEEDNNNNEGSSVDATNNNEAEVLKKLAVTPSPKPAPTHATTPKDSSSSSSSPPPLPPPKPGPPKETHEQLALRRSHHPLNGITEPGPNDCLFGRGGGTNHHPGNKHYRKMVEDKKSKYLHSKRLDKPLVAMEIIHEWRSLDPPGRFLKQDDRTKLWNDVGDKKAREKTSQALREKTPVKAREGEEVVHAGDGIRGDPQRTARFEPGITSPTGRNVKRLNLARDHSLGETFVGSNEISLEGFSWDDADKPVVRNADAHVEVRGGAGRGAAGGGGGQPQLPQPTTYPPHYQHAEHPPPPPHYYPNGEHHHQHPPHQQYGYHARENSLSNNPLSDANVSRPAPPNAFTDPAAAAAAASYYGHHYPPGYAHPPPPPGGPHGHHPPPPYHAHHYGSPPPPPPNHHHPQHGQYSYPQPPPPPQRSREHSLQSNPLKGASTTQPARDTFNDEESHASSSYDGHRPPPLPSPTYDSRGGQQQQQPPPPPLPPPYYGYAPSPTQHGAPSPQQHGSPYGSSWPAPPGTGNSPHPSPQFSYHPGSNPSAFGRYDSGTTNNSAGGARSNSLRSLGSSVDAFYDRRDSSSAGDSGRYPSSSSATASAAENPSAAGTFQDYSKIAELIRDSSDKSSVVMVERSNSYDERKESGYEDGIQRSKSLPYEDSGGAKENAIQQEGGAAKLSDASGNGVRKPSLIRKLSGGAMHLATPPPPPNGILRPEPANPQTVTIHRPEPVKRDTSNQPETLETKRSIKRVVLSRDQSAVARRLKEEQYASHQAQLVAGGATSAGNRPPPLGARVSSRLSKSELLDRKLSVEINKLGLEDINDNNRPHGMMGRMTTEDVLASLIDDDDIFSGGSLGGSPSPTLLGVPPPLIVADGSSPPQQLGEGDRSTTIDAIAMDIANGNNNPTENSDWDGTLDLIDETAPSASGGNVGINADIAEKWLKGET